MKALPARQAASTMAYFWLLLGLCYWLPTPLAKLLQGVAPSPAANPPRTIGQSSPAPRAEERAETAAGPATEQAASPAPLDEELVRIEDPHASLRHFANKLRQTLDKQGNTVTRVTHYGDSLIDLDHITAPLRRAFQRRYGDAGHGFSLLAKPWPWYNQHGVGLARSSGWQTYRLVGGKRPDARLGLGASAAESPRGRRWLLLRSKASVRFSRIEVAFLRQPGGGQFSVEVDGQTRATHSTAAAARGSGFLPLQVADGNHELKIRTTGKVRLFGVVLERDAPGVVWDNLPMVSVRFHQLTKLPQAHFGEQLTHRDSNLVIFQFGANDTINFGGDLPRYGHRIGQVMQRVHRYLPQASCLIIGPLDRLVRTHKGLHSPRVIARVARMQRKSALENRCAFFDAQAAMGGAGSMAEWLKKGLALKDMVHLNPRGGRLFAARVEAALLHAVTGSANKR